MKLVVFGKMLTNNKFLESKRLKVELSTFAFFCFGNYVHNLIFSAYFKGFLIKNKENLSVVAVVRLF